jgi:hypothetical protein
MLAQFLTKGSYISPSSKCELDKEAIIASTRAAARSSAALTESGLFGLVCLSPYFRESPLVLIDGQSIDVEVSGSLPVLEADFDRAAIAAIISSTFSAAYFSAALETSVELLALDLGGLAPEAFLRSRNALHFSEC